MARDQSYESVINRGRALANFSDQYYVVKLGVATKYTIYSLGIIMYDHHYYQGLSKRSHLKLLSLDAETT